MNRCFGSNGGGHIVFTAFFTMVLAAAAQAQTLRLDASGAFFTEQPAGTDPRTAATTTAGDISYDSFTRYAGKHQSPRMLENLGFDYVLARECEALGLARTAPTFARSLAMRRLLESQQSPTGTAIGGSLARYASDELRDLRIRELVGARRSIDDEALLARFHHRYGVDGIRVRVRQILCTDAASAPQTALQRANDLHTRLQNGEDPQIEAACVKELGTLFEQSLPELAHALYDLEPRVAGGPPAAQVLAYLTQVAPSFSLRGGTREILRGIIARGLGAR